MILETSYSIRLGDILEWVSRDERRSTEAHHHKSPLEVGNDLGYHVIFTK